MTDQLDSKQDPELNRMFATHVCSYSIIPSLIDGAILCGVRGAAGTGTFPLPSFCTNANSVLPWLEKFRTTAEHNAERQLPWQVLCEGDDECYVGRGSTFARAAVLALLRSATKAG